MIQLLVDYARMDFHGAAVLEAGTVTDAFDAEVETALIYDRKARRCTPDDFDGFDLEPLFGGDAYAVRAPEAPETVAQLKAWLSARGVVHDPAAKKADLVALFESNR